MKLMIVAHPDDESLFGGAQLLEGGWKVICMTNGNNTVRRKEFEQVMKMTDSQFEMWNYPDGPLRKFEAPAIDGLRQAIQNQSWDKIVTHGRRGEYGHAQHKHLHAIVQSVVPHFWAFDLFGSRLDEPTWKGKLELINVYKSQKRICSRLMRLVKNEKIVKELGCLAKVIL